MKVERGDRQRLGSCNFCHRGRMDHANYHFTYPYDKVTVFYNEKSNGLKASICDDCLDELHAKSAMAAL